MTKKIFDFSYKMFFKNKLLVTDFKMDNSTVFFLKESQKTILLSVSLKTVFFLKKFTKNATIVKTISHMYLICEVHLYHSFILAFFD